ncbi:MAG: TIGR03560 family F420-dependent LLM class oxidoreductase [Candidatus Binatia bacterium]|nr:TIGR03560 family F420-dependent LLM class oxidoreductase [Candidatus Binatia bacterium]
MKPLRFGLFLPQVGQTWEGIRERVVTADRLGFDSVWFVDHMWMRGLPDLDHLEAWTLMSAAASITERIRIGTLVLCNSYRNPAFLAKMASSLDQVSGGRFVLGIGAGWMEEEYHAYGYPFPPARVRIEQLEEAIHVIKRLFTQDRATFQGKYYSVAEAVNRPKPKQQPHPPILIGGAGERRLLRVVAEHANIWNCPNNVAAQLPQKLAVLRRHCEAVGRPFEEIEISEQCVFITGKTPAEVEEKTTAARALLGSVWDLDRAYRGTPEQLVEIFRQREQQGVTFFIGLFGDLNQRESLELFAKEVIPACRS